MARLDSPVTLWIAGPKAADYFDPFAQSCADQQRWRQIRSERRKLDWMVSRALLARAAARPGDAVSLSHSNGHAAVAIAPPGVQLGIDIEFIRPRNIISLARTAFANRECEHLELLSDGKEIRHFYALWTIKEALAKALRVDLLKVLREFEILVTEDGWQAQCATNIPWSAEVFALGDSLILTVVCAGPATDLVTATPTVHCEWLEATHLPWKRIAHIRHCPIVSSSPTRIHPAQPTTEGT